MNPTGDPRIDESTHSVIVGTDEAGFGAWAGPLVVAAAATPRDWTDPRVKDSKKLSEKQREALYEEFSKSDQFPIAWIIVEPSEIDERGVWNCLIRAHTEAANGTHWRLVYEPLHVVDGNIPVEGAMSLPKADNLVPAVSLASIFAKVIRDRIMVELDKKYPGYDFAKSRGYGVPKHQLALRELGPCPAHRRSYGPVAAAEALSEPREAWTWFDDPVVMSGLNILYIDDEEVLCRAFQRLWGRHNSVTTVHTRKEGVAKASKSHFDLVVCDIMLTDGTGVDVFHEISRVSPRHAERFVFVTGGFTSSIKLPDRPVLLKPWKTDDMVRVFKRILNGHSGVVEP